MAFTHGSLPFLFLNYLQFVSYCSDDDHDPKQLEGKVSFSLQLEVHHEGKLARMEAEAIEELYVLACSL